MKKTDFREFVFTATGQDTDLSRLDFLDVYDNVLDQLDRLAAVIQLLSAVDGDDLDSRLPHGIALVLGDIHARVRAVLELKRPEPARGRPARRK